VLSAVLSFVVIFALVAGAIAVIGAREDRRLRAAARRYRELELEGVEELAHPDPFPEFAAGPGERVVEPGGQVVAADRMLREELRRLRAEAQRKNGRPRHAWHHR
jgi:hypothetical protein